MPRPRFYVDYGLVQDIAKYTKNYDKWPVCDNTLPALCDVVYEIELEEDARELVRILNKPSTLVRKKRSEVHG